MMDTYAQVIKNIIKEQQSIIGPIALDQAKKVPGLQINNINDMKVTGKVQDVLGGLVSEYEKLFGKASVAICKEAFEPFKDKIPSSDIPDILKN